MKHLMKAILWMAIGTLGFGLIACEDSDQDASIATGVLRLALVDAPLNLEGIEAITLVIDRVRVHASADADDDSNDGGWIDLLPDSLDAADRSYDLLELVDGVEAVLGEVELETGLYTQIRLGIESSTITIDGEVFELVIPSGAQSGLKLVHPFEIEADGLTALTLDFDAARSVREVPPGSAQYKMSPVIRVIDTALAGAITGTVLPDTVVAVVSAVSAASGDTVTTTFSAIPGGGYELPGLPAASYHVLVTAPGFVAAADSNIVVELGTVTMDVDFVLLPARVEVE